MGAAFAVTGAFVILGGFEVFDSPFAWTDLLAVLSGFLLAMNNLVFRAVQEVKVSVKIGVMFYGTFTLAAFFLLAGVESFPEFISTQAWSGLFFYALVWLLLANIGSQWGITHMEAGRSSIIIIMELLTAVVSATLIGDEIMNLHEYLGGVLIISAAFIEALRTKDENLK